MNYELGRLKGKQRGQIVKQHAFAMGYQGILNMIEKAEHNSYSFILCLQRKEYDTTKYRLQDTDMASILRALV